MRELTIPTLFAAAVITVLVLVLNGPAITTITNVAEILSTR